MIVVEHEPQHTLRVLYIVLTMFGFNFVSIKLVWQFAIKPDFVFYLFYFVLVFIYSGALFVTSWCHKDHYKHNITKLTKANNLIGKI